MATIQQQLGVHYPFARDAGVTDVWFPPTAGRYTFKTGAEQTEGRLLQVLCVEARGGAAPLHVHHDADETWYVLDGEITIFVGEARLKAGPGDFILGPKGVAHTFLVTSERAELFVSFAPAGSEGPSGIGLEGFFREIGIPAVPGEPRPDPVAPDPEDFARRAARYAIEILGPPPTLE
jgi:mannose-6-phosphate isomerase-like protein (cupin superfamily)